MVRSALTTFAAEIDNHRRHRACPARPAPLPTAAHRRALAVTRHLAVNPIACDGHGLCAELLPELIRLDDWGYPLIDPAPSPSTWSRTPAGR